MIQPKIPDPNALAERWLRDIAGQKGTWLFDLAQKNKALALAEAKRALRRLRKQSKESVALAAQPKTVAHLVAELLNII